MIRRRRNFDPKSAICRQCANPFTHVKVFAYYCDDCLEQRRRASHRASDKRRPSRAGYKPPCQQNRRKRKLIPYAGYDGGRPA